MINEESLKKITPNEELYEYLTENYKSVKLLDNGMYYAVDSHNNELFIPSNARESIDLVAYYPGMGGSWGGEGIKPERADAYYLRELMSGDNPPEYAVSISLSADDNWDNDILSYSTNALDAGNIKVDGVLVMSFSASGGTGFIKLDKYLNEHPELADNSAMLIADGYNIKGMDSKNSLIDNKVPIYLISYEEGKIQTSDELVDKGYNFFKINTQDTGHSYINRDMFLNRLPDYILGYSDDIPNIGSEDNPNYQAIVYNPKTGEYEPVSLDILQLRKKFSLSQFDGVDLSGLFKKDNFEIRETIPELLNKYKYLQNLDTNVSINGIRNLDDLALSSSMIYVSNKMASLKTQIKNSNFLNGKTLLFRNETGIPGCITSYLNRYYDVMGNLMTALNEQADAVISVGQAIVDMDNDLNNRAEDIE